MLFVFYTFTVTAQGPPTGQLGQIFALPYAGPCTVSVQNFLRFQYFYSACMHATMCLIYYYEYCVMAI